MNEGKGMESFGKTIRKSTLNALSEELCGKRLLILGGSLWRDSICAFCRSNGIAIIAAGNDSSSGICDIADEYYEVNSTDAYSMKELIQTKNIDGVYMGGNEPVIVAACQYINELGLPCYCSIDQWNALQDKKRFKALCSQFGLPVVRELSPDAIKDEDFPLVTKPVDGCGSMGFSVCRNVEELEKGWKAASKASPTGRVIVEQYVRNEAVGVLYTLNEGKLVFSTLEDKYPVHFEKHGTYVGGFFDFESPFAGEFRSLFEDKIQGMIRYLDIREGNFWMEVFHDNGRYFFNEAGFRIGGSGSLYPVDYFSGINQVAADIYYALTGKSKIHGFPPIHGQETPRGKKYAVYPLFASSGTIKRIEGYDALLDRPNILRILSKKKPGDSVPDDGSFGQIVALVHFLYDDVEELRETLHAIHTCARLKNDQDQDMVLRLLDIERFVPQL
jgi:hypothetical protein